MNPTWVELRGLHTFPWQCCHDDNAFKITSVRKVIDAVIFSFIKLIEMLSAYTLLDGFSTKVQVHNIVVTFMVLKPSIWPLWYQYLPIWIAPIWVIPIWVVPIWVYQSDLYESELYHLSYKATEVFSMKLNLATPRLVLLKGQTSIPTPKRLGIPHFSGKTLTSRRFWKGRTCEALMYPCQESAFKGSKQQEFAQIECLLILISIFFFL